jgi:hypothetical protein
MIGFSAAVLLESITGYGIIGGACTRPLFGST